MLASNCKSAHIHSSKTVTPLHTSTNTSTLLCEKLVQSEVQERKVVKMLVFGKGADLSALVFHECNCVFVQRCWCIGVSKDITFVGSCMKESPSGVVCVVGKGISRENSSESSIRSLFAVCKCPNSTEHRWKVFIDTTVSGEKRRLGKKMKKEMLQMYEYYYFLCFCSSSAAAFFALRYALWRR